jgi:hypothetical protein
MIKEGPFDGLMGFSQVIRLETVNSFLNIYHTVIKLSVNDCKLSW